MVETEMVRLLEPLIKRPLALSEAAKELGVKLPRLHDYVLHLKFGLLEVARLYSRSGRAVERYRSTAVFRPLSRGLE